MIENLSHIIDNNLLLMFQAGDKRAYEEIYKRYWALMYVYACKILQDKNEAQDIVQEVFVYLWVKERDLVLKSSLSAYLYAAVRYKIFDAIDRKRVRSDYAASLQEFIERGYCVADTHIREKELSSQIEKGIALLPAKMKVVFELSRKAHLSQQEIGERLNISDKTVKKQINNAIKILRLKLDTLISILIAIYFC